MKSFVYLLAFCLLLSSCKTKVVDDNLPKPIEMKPVVTNEFGTIPLSEVREMRALKDEILELCHPVKCTKPEDWKVIGLGKKPCGGFTEYIAYHHSEEEQYLLEKIEIYNNKTYEILTKYPQISDCMIKEEPIVKCEGGKVVLKDVTMTK